MYRLALLIALPFLHAGLLQSSENGADPGLWDLAISSADAGGSIIDAENLPSQNAIGPDDSFFPEPSWMTAMDDDAFALFGESDPYTISMDQCSSSSRVGTSLDRRLRIRGAFCTDDSNGADNVNTNPSLAGLDATERIIDPDNRRQCERKYVTLCCEGPVYSRQLVADCYYCRFFFFISLVSHYFAFAFGFLNCNIVEPP